MLYNAYIYLLFDQETIQVKARILVELSSRYNTLAMISNSCCETYCNFLKLCDYKIFLNT